MIPLSFTDELRKFEEECRRRTDSFLAELPPEQVHALRDYDLLLEQLYKFACCFWGCHGKEHVLEHLAGRCVSSLVSARRLIEAGYYDEALSLIRSVGEIANLLNLFWADNAEIRPWLDSPEKERRRRFSPVQVRRKLGELQTMVPFNDTHYHRLCELSVHPTPQTRPNAHQDARRPVLGAYFQPQGFIAASWELCWALAVVAGPIAKLGVFSEAEAKKMVELVISLFEKAAPHVDEGDDT